MEASQADPQGQDQGQDGGQDAEPVIVGDSGQQPLSASAQHDPNAVGPTSAPPAGLQSGVPLPEDRAAGVQPNEQFRGDAQGRGPDGHPIQAPPEDAITEQDGSTE